MKRMARETRFFSVCWLGKFEDFRSLPRNFSHLELLALSSWTQVAGTPEHPKNQQIFRVIQVPSEFLPKVDQLGPSQGNSTNLTPRLASLLAILPWTRHLCRPCHIASNSQPLPAQNCTSESESSKRHGHMKLGPVLSSSDWPELSRNALSIHPAWCRGAAVCNKKI